MCQAGRPTLTAASPLANSSVFTPLVKGGVVEPTVKDVAGNALAADFVWRFTTEAAPRRKLSMQHLG